jgi:hypothetical protein
MNMKPIQSLGGCYAATEDGRIFSLARTSNVTGHPSQRYKSVGKRELGQRTDRRGYATCAISANGKTKTARVHRLVMEAFFPREDANQLDVNHKNGIKTDNRLENLEWVTRGENHRHRYQALKQKHSMEGRHGALHHRSMAVVGFDAQGQKVCEFAALMDAQRAGYLASKISNCLSGKRATHKGLYWRAPDLSSFV